MAESIFDTPLGGLPAPSQSAPAHSPTRPRRAPWLMFFGVIVPALVLLWELATGFCAGVFFDPIPTFWHVLMVATVPVVTCFCRRTLITGVAKKPGWLAAGIGFALVVSCYYTALYVPLMPASVMALLFFGLGLLSLSPALGFAALSSVAWRLWEQRDIGASSGKALVGGVLLGVAAIGALDGPRYVGRMAVGMAVSDETETRETGLALLRAVGSEDTVLRACYESSAWDGGGKDAAGWVASYLGSVDRDDAREVYYRMTGKAFNNTLPPTSRARFTDDGWTRNRFDEDRGGEVVGGRVEGLSLESSRLDCHIDPVSALSYTEWALVFGNRAATTAEARFGVDLPPGAAVSRLTLWINGEPFEAAFGTKSQTRGAYEKVVRRQRDPVLVTQSESGRVLVQCFPVPARGEMKIRFGVTAPLDARGRAWLPSMVEQNFTIGKRFEHQVWAQSSAAELATGLPGLGSAEPRGGGHGLEGSVERDGLGSGRAWISAGEIDRTATVHAIDRLGEPGSPRVLVRNVSRAERTPDREVVVVVDTAVGMKEQWHQVEEAINSLTGKIDVALVLAGDRVEVAAGAAEVAKSLARVRPAGGIDNAPALLRGLELAGRSEGTPVLWLHGPQPRMLTKASQIEQALERRLAPRAIYSLQISDGPDRLSEVFAEHVDLRPVPRGEDLVERLELLFGSGPEFTYRYEPLIEGAPVPEGSTEVWDHLVRSWALSKVRSAIDTADGVNRKILANLAARYQLVTPLTGAVVLERKQQFEDAGLEQLSASETPSMPSIPEPSTGVLALLGGLWFALRRRRKR